MASPRKDFASELTAIEAHFRPICARQNERGRGSAAIAKNKLEMENQANAKDLEELSGELQRAEWAYSAKRVVFDLAIRGTLQSYDVWKALHQKGKAYTVGAPELEWSPADTRPEDWTHADLESGAMAALN